MRPLKTPVGGGPYRRVRSRGAREVQPVEKPEQDILEGFGQQAQVFDVRGTGVEIREICSFRSVWIMHMLQREQLMETRQALLQTPGEHRGVADIVDQRESRLQRRSSAKKQRCILESFGMEPQKILQFAMRRGSQVEHHVLLGYRAQDARGFKTRLGLGIPGPAIHSRPGHPHSRNEEPFYPTPEELAFPVAPSAQRVRPEMQDPSGFARPSWKSSEISPDMSVPTLLPRGCPP